MLGIYFNICKTQAHRVIQPNVLKLTNILLSFPQVKAHPSISQSPVYFRDIEEKLIGKEFIE